MSKKSEAIEALERHIQRIDAFFGERKTTVPPYRREDRAAFQLAIAALKQQSPGYIDAEGVIVERLRQLTGHKGEASIPWALEAMEALERKGETQEELSYDEMQALGFGFSKACTLLAAGHDPRQHEAPGLIDEWREAKEKPPEKDHDGRG